MTSLEENEKVKFSQYLVLYYVREKVKPQWIISYKVFKEEYGYYPMLDISIFPTSMQLKYSLRGIHHCVTVVGKCIFDSKFHFHFFSLKRIWNTVALMIMKKSMNILKVLLKSIRFFTKYNNKKCLLNVKLYTMCLVI